MNSTKYSFFCLVCLMTVSFLVPSIAICDDQSEGYTPDQALVQAAFKKGKELGHQVLAIYLEKEGDLVKKLITTSETIITRDQENDMVVNVGEFPFTISDIKLLKGEYGIFKNGKFIKQTGKITAD